MCDLWLLFREVVNVAQVDKYLWRHSRLYFIFKAITVIRVVNCCVGSLAFFLWVHIRTINFIQAVKIYSEHRKSCVHAACVCLSIVYAMCLWLSFQELVICALICWSLHCWLWIRTFVIAAFVWNHYIAVFTFSAIFYAMFLIQRHYYNTKIYFIHTNSNSNNTCNIKCQAK